MPFCTFFTFMWVLYSPWRVFKHFWMIFPFEKKKRRGKPFTVKPSQDVGVEGLVTDGQWVILVTINVINQLLSQLSRFNILTLFFSNSSKVTGENHSVDSFSSLMNLRWNKVCIIQWLVLHTEEWKLKSYFPWTFCATF